MPFNFPDSPTLNQVYAYNGNEWSWNGEAWDAVDQFSKSSGSSLVGFIQSGTGAVARSVEAKLRGQSVDLTDFGSGPDWRVALQNAITAASGRTLRIPAGTYNISLLTGAGIGSIPAGTVIEGEGQATVLNFTVTDNSFRTIFTLAANDITIRNLKINLTAASGQTIILFAFGACAGIRFERLHLTANSTGTSGSFNNETYVWVCPDSATTQSDIDIDNCYVQGWHYPLLKTNASLSIQQRWRLTRCTFVDTVVSHWSPNSPLGAWDDMLVQGNTFMAQSGAVAGLGHHVGFASIRNVRVIGNHFIGHCDGEAIRFEENCQNFVVSGNTVEISSSVATWGKGIVVLEANVGGGGTQTPMYGVISGNVIRRTGTRDTNGIELLFDGINVAPPGERIIVTGNVIEGFTRGIQVDTPNNENRITGNLIEDCTTGIVFTDGTPEIRDNTLVNCTTGLSGNGIVGRHQFFNCTTLATGASGPCCVSGVAVQTDAVTLNGGGVDTDVNLFNIGRRAYGEIHYCVKRDNVTYVAGVRTESWDGAALTDTARVNDQPGGIALTNFNVSAGVLRIRIFNAGALLNDVFVGANFEGMVVYD